LKQIIGGNGLSAAAAGLKITPAPARTPHYRTHYRIFEKTGTICQAELIRGFFESSLHPLALELP
jgi:hypothetical protein